MLVLEDAHLVESPDVWDSLGVLLRHRPAALLVLLTARSDPPWPAAAMRSEGRLRELREPDLRFTLDEARTFFAECAGVPLAEAAVRQVYSTAEGWAMSMRGVALAVGAGRPVEEVLAGGVLTDDLTEYLLTEVLAVLSGADREFLLRTAALRSLDPTLCEEVTGRADSGRTLVRLARRKEGELQNVELWQKLAQVIAAHQVEWRWVRGHADHPKNEYADHLAVRSAERQERSNGLVPSGFDAWLGQQRARGKYREYDPDQELHERA